jgi:hypothetical protein
MSLYNALFGRNPMSHVLLATLGLDEGSVGRFRDCHLSRGEDGKTRIVVFTRNGGGNREDYQGVTDELQAHPNYLRDYDDDFDCTYASYEFSVPEKYAAEIEELMEDNGPEAPPMERFKNLLDLLSSGKAVVR